MEKIYPFLARQIVDDYGITSGVCLDVGSGAGQVGIELAERTSLRVYLLDANAEVLAVAKQHARASAACDRAIPLRADVHRLPFVTGSVDLIVSRGSIFFWEDKPKGLREVYRILKPGGIALLGGGAGRYLPARERERFVREREKALGGKTSPEREAWRRVRSEEYFLKIHEQAEIPRFKLIFDTPGIWTEIKK